MGSENSDLAMCVSRLGDIVSSSLCILQYIQSINILFYVCSHRGDIRQKQKHIIIIYTNFPTGL